MMTSAGCGPMNGVCATGRHTPDTQSRTTPRNENKGNEILARPPRHIPARPAWRAVLGVLRYFNYRTKRDRKAAVGLVFETVVEAGI